LIFQNPPFREAPDIPARFQEMENPITGPGVRSIARNSMYLMGSQWVNMAIRLCYVILLARWLGPKQYGIFNYAMSWYMVLLPFSGLGLGVILSHEIPRTFGNPREVLSRTFTLRVLSFSFFAVLCALAGFFLETDREARTLLFVFSSALMGRSLATWTSSVFTAHEASQYSFFFHSLFRSAELLLSLAVLLLGGGLTGLAAIHSLTWWMEGGIGVLWIGKRYSPVRFEGSWKDLKPYLRSGVLTCIGSVASTFLLQGSLILYRSVAGLGEGMGQLALAVQALILMGTLPGYLTAGALPVLSRSTLRGDGKARFFAESAIRAALVGGTALGLTGLALAPRLIPAVFGPSYGEAGVLFGWIFWILIPLTVSTIIAGLFQSMGEYAVPTLFALLSVAVLTVLIHPMISAAGRTGVVAALGIALLVQSGGLAAAMKRSGLLDPVPALFRPLLAVLPACAAYAALRDLGIVSLFGGLSVLFAGTIFLRVLSPEEWSALRLAGRAFSPGGDGKKDAAGPTKS
jgi:O-antigen/teichoic acid export membrane protein